MRSFSILTLGCKVNQYESQQIRELLEHLGLDQVETSDNPDLVVVNTCCVTAVASAKSRRQIHKATKTAPNAAVVVCGCLPAVETGEIAHLDTTARIVSDRDKLAAILSTLAGAQPNPAPSHADNGTGRSEHGIADNGAKPNADTDLAHCECMPLLASFHGHTRAFLKVQDGCDGYCTYCIIPKARPVVQSKPLEVVLDEARALVAAGHEEIVITGIHLGSYGQLSVHRSGWPLGHNPKLAELLTQIAQIDGLSRIRLSSLDPDDITPPLLEVVASHPNIMPHLHLSLQSGSDSVLKRMARQYRADDFREKVSLARSFLDRPAVTTDIIVGFPGEADADFEQTVALANEVRFAKMHVFAFSPREGTSAAKMLPRVHPRVIKERSRTLRELDAELQYTFREQFLGETATVLIESANGPPTGRTERYFPVQLQPSDRRPTPRELVRVVLLENSRRGFTAELLHDVVTSEG